MGEGLAMNGEDRGMSYLEKATDGTKVLEQAVV